MAPHDGLAEPDLSFAHAWHKLERANKHISDLNELCRVFIQAHPRTIVIENNLDKCRTRITVLPTQEISTEIALTAGDAVHNIRSSLDFCWMGLARALSDKPDRITFPFSKELEGLNGTIAKALKHLPIQGLKEIVLNSIKPYEAGNSILYSINRLDNRDKHNLLVLTAAVTHIRLIVLTNNETKRFGGSQIIRNCQVEGNVVIGFQTLEFDPGDPFELEREPDVAIEVMISEPAVLQSTPVVPHLAAALQEARKAVDLFRAAFGDGALRKIDREV